MPTSLWGQTPPAALEAARSPRTRRVQVDGEVVEVPTPFPSPPDWRDHWIYFLLLDRFNNPGAAPRNLPWDSSQGVFQGGTINGVRAQLGYLRELGVGAIWLSPVLKNCQFSPFTYHGYGIQDFVAVEPRFSSDPEAARADPSLAEAELRGLVDEAHARGMYVILDVVLNHAGDVFEYVGHGSTAEWRDEPYEIRWRDEHGRGRPDWTQAPADPPADAAVWPAELRHNAFFRRRGKGGEAGGDFESLKELVTDVQANGDFPVRNVLIQAHQLLIAKYDLDGFRIDTLKFIEPEFARVFGNAMREFALSIGKRNFFTFGEVYDADEAKIARFIGRQASDPGDLVGVDAALDFPLFFGLPGVVKGLKPPTEVLAVFERRKQAQRGLLSSHGEASRFFVTFLDNHDQKERFSYSPPEGPHRFDDQVSLGLGCLFALQGIPCLYYGTEQGLRGTLERYAPDVRLEDLSDATVREALWGKPDAFDPGHPFAGQVRALAAVRAEQPALRYGRQYFRPISGNGIEFGLSSDRPGVLAFSRLLSGDEVLVVANTNPNPGQSWSGEVIVDAALNEPGRALEVLFSNKAAFTQPSPVAPKPVGSVVIHEADGRITRGPAAVIAVKLQPMEIQLVGRRGA